MAEIENYIFGEGKSWYSVVVSGSVGFCNLLLPCTAIISSGLWKLRGFRKKMMEDACTFR